MKAKYWEYSLIGKVLQHKVLGLIPTTWKNKQKTKKPKLSRLIMISRIQAASLSFLTSDLPGIILGGDQKFFFHLDLSLVFPPEFVGCFLVLWAENEEEDILSYRL
jgi:hypothetical protein